MKQHLKTKNPTVLTNKVVAIMVVAMLSITSYVSFPQANATTCSASSGPKGVTISGSNVWIGLSATSKLGTTPTSSCSITSYTAQLDPTFLAFAGNGKLAFTQKGSTNTNSCISAFNTATHVVERSTCLSGKGADDVSNDPTNSNIVWNSWYYYGQIANWDTTTGNMNLFVVPKPGTTTPSPEGIRVDSGGTVWVADEANARIDKYVPGTNTWTQYAISQGNPWFISIDPSNTYLYASVNPTGTPYIIKMTKSTGSYTAYQAPSGTSIGYQLMVKSDNSKAVMDFESSGQVAAFNIGTSSWGTPVNLGSTSNPIGLWLDSSGNYWIGLWGTDQLTTGPI